MVAVRFRLLVVTKQLIRKNSLFASQVIGWGDVFKMTCNVLNGTLASCLIYAQALLEYVIFIV